MVGVDAPTEVRAYSSTAAGKPGYHTERRARASVLSRPKCPPSGFTWPPCSTCTRSAPATGTQRRSPRLLCCFSRRVGVADEGAARHTGDAPQGAGRRRMPPGTAVAAQGSVTRSEGSAARTATVKSVCKAGPAATKALGKKLERIWLVVAHVRRWTCAVELVRVRKSRSTGLVLPGLCTTGSLVLSQQNERLPVCPMTTDVPVALLQQQCSHCRRSVQLKGLSRR